MQTRFTLRQLEYLVAVGQHGSVTLAAALLSVSAPSVSSAISQLEAEFGLPLFVRKHAQGMAPTAGGRDLIAEAQRVLDAARRLTDVAGRHKGTVHGTLRVGCLSSFAQIVVPGLRKAFLALHPDVDFRQFQRHQALLIDGLRDACVDIALTYDLAVPADLEFATLAVLPPFAILPQAHPLADRPRRIGGRPCAVSDDPSGSAAQRRIFPVAFRRGRPEAPHRGKEAGHGDGALAGGQ